MEHNTKNKMTLFAANSQAVRKEFTWHNAQTKRLAALLYAQDNKPVDCEKIRQCYDLIKQNTGVFSTFRGNMCLYVAALLSLSTNPHGLFDEVMKVYDLLKDVKFSASDYLVTAACQIAAQTSPPNHVNVVTRARAFYDGMKENHFFGTSQDDYIFVAMLGLSELDVKPGAERIEQLYNRFKPEFWNKNSVQALAQVLVLGGAGEEAEDRVLELRAVFKKQKIRLDKTYTLPSLGLLALLPVNTDTVVKDIGEVQTYLRTQKGFGTLSVDNQELLLYASSIVASEYTQSVKDSLLAAVLSTGITNIIITRQTAMTAASS